MSRPRALVLVVVLLLLVGGGLAVLLDVERATRGQARERGADAPAASTVAPVLATSTPPRRSLPQANVPADASEAQAPPAREGSTPDSERAEPRPWHGRVDGRVEDGAGRPVVGAALLLRGQGLVARSDETGSFVVDVFLERRRFLGGASGRRAAFAIEAEGFASTERTLSMSSEGALHLGTIRLEPGGEVRGRVLAPDGSPLDGARVGWRRAQRLPDSDAILAHHGLERMEGSEPPDRWADAEGDFVLRGVPVGEGFLVASAAEHAHARSNLFRVVAGSTTERVLTLPPGDTRLVTLSGRVLDPERRGVSGVRVVVREEGGRSQELVVTGEDGRFETTLEQSLQAGSITLVATDPEQRGYPARLEGVDPAAGPVELVLERARFFEVRQVDGDGRPVAWGHVRFEGDHRDPSWVRGLQPLGEEGARRFLLPRTPFSLVSMAAGYENRTVGPFLPESVSDPLEITLTPGQYVSGRVLVAGVPLSGAHVGLQVAWAPERVARSTSLALPERPFWAIGSAPRRPLDATTDAEGRFVITLHREGFYRLVVAAEGFPQSVFGPWNWSLDGADGLELGLQRAGVIQGRVLVPPGSSPEGRLVGVSNGLSIAHTALVAPDGSFRIEGLASGRYQVRPCTPPAAAHQVFATWSLADTSEFTLEWDCEVYPGRDTLHILDLRGEEDFVLHGRLPQPPLPGGWTAMLSEPPFALAQVPLAADGSFEFRLSRGGPLELKIACGTRVFRQSLDLQPGLNEWLPAVAWGRLELRGSAYVGYQSVLQSGLIFEAEVTCKGFQGGAPVLMVVPAGAGQFGLTDREWSSESARVGEVRVPVGETVVIDLDQVP